MAALSASGQSTLVERGDEGPDQQLIDVMEILVAAAAGGSELGEGRKIPTVRADGVFGAIALQVQILQEVRDQFGEGAAPLGSASWLGMVDGGSHEGAPSIPTLSAQAASACRARST